MVLVVHLLKTKKELKKIKETGDSRYIYQNESDKACFFNMIWVMEILKIKIEEHLLIKCYVIKNLILLRIQNVMDINVDFLQWFINFVIKKLLVVLLK